MAFGGRKSDSARAAERSQHAAVQQALEQARLVRMLPAACTARPPLATTALAAAPTAAPTAVPIAAPVAFVKHGTGAARSQRTLNPKT